MHPLKDKFRGCLLGAMLGDVIGAVVEAESSAYIAKRYSSVDDILGATDIPEVFGGIWQVGRYTDDTQMMLCVAEWLVDAGEADEASLSGKDLLARFASAYQPWRRYGPGAARVLRAFRDHPDAWRELSTLAFPTGHPIEAEID